MHQVRHIDPARVEIGAEPSEAEIRQLVTHQPLATVQSSTPASPATWSLLNRVLFSVRPDIELRIYGNASASRDLGFLALMSNVRRLAVEALRRVDNIDAIAEMPRLDHLALGVFEQHDWGVLERLRPGLMTLRLGATRSQVRLDAIARFRDLKVLSLDGQMNGIDVVSGLAALQELNLRSITTPDLGCVSSLDRLWSLTIVLGSLGSFRGIQRKPGLKYLAIRQVRRVTSLDIVGTLPDLQHLYLQSLPAIDTLDGLGQTRSLRRLVLEHMRGLRSFQALSTVPTLEEFALIDGRPQQPQMLLPVLTNPAVRRVSAFFGSDLKNAAFARLRDAHGKSDWDRSMPLAYR